MAGFEKGNGSQGIKNIFESSCFRTLNQFTTLSLIGVSKEDRNEKKVFSRYRHSTCRVLDLGVAETREINENIYIDLNVSGNLVAMAIEHAETKPIFRFFPMSSLTKNRITKKCNRQALQEADFKRLAVIDSIHTRKEIV